MHQHHACLKLRANRRQPASTRSRLHRLMISAPASNAASAVPPCSVHRQDRIRSCLENSFQHGSSRACSSSVLTNGESAPAREPGRVALRPQIQNVGPLLQQLKPMRHRCLWIKKGSAIAERSGVTFTTPSPASAAPVPASDCAVRQFVFYGSWLTFLWAVPEIYTSILRCVAFISPWP